MHEAVVASYGQIAFYKSFFFTVLQFPLPKKGFIVNASKYSLLAEQSKRQAPCNLIFFVSFGQNYTYLSNLIT